MEIIAHTAHLVRSQKQPVVMTLAILDKEKWHY